MLYPHLTITSSEIFDRQRALGSPRNMALGSWQSKAMSLFERESRSSGIVEEHWTAYVQLL